MGLFARLRDVPALVMLAIGLLVPALQAGAADTIAVDKQLPTLQSLAGGAKLRPSAPAQTATVEPICDVFANGYDAVGATPCAGCFDNTVNFDETDVDCGGTYCMACADGQQCLVDNDCSSSLCNGSTHLCAPVTCTDTIQDGTETDIDCGGGACPSCGTGKACTVNADCTTGLCNAGVCVASVCGNAIVEPGEVCDDGNTVTETSCPYGQPNCVACNSTCSATLNLTGPYCGDGSLDAANGEVCDDGNTVTETSCPYGQPNCTQCNSTCSATLNLTGPYCGDGNADFADGEVCDDGNTVTETSCPYGQPNCTQCNSTCSETLNLTGPYCGDGVTDFAYGEVCDDGNNVDETSCPFGQATCTACNSTCTQVLVLTGPTAPTAQSAVPTARPAKGK